MQLRLLFSVVLLVEALCPSSAFFQSLFGSLSATGNEDNGSVVHASLAGNTKTADDNVVIALLSNGETADPVFFELTPAQCEDASIAAGSNNPDLSFSLSSVVCSAAGLDPDCTLFNECGAHVQSCTQFGQKATKASVAQAISTMVDTTVCDDKGNVEHNANGDADNNVLHAVPKDKHFIWPGHHVGHTVVLNHVDSIDADGSGGPISVVTLSLSPRIFRIENFFTEMERIFLVRTHNDSSNPLLQRSTTGDRRVSKVYEKRTSDTAFDTNSPIALAVKRRGFEVARVLAYDEKKADGIQVLRYNATNSYVPHLDYMSPKQMPQIPEGYVYDSSAPSSAPTSGRTNTYLHNYDTMNGGSNRFATIFLYLSDVEEGGETVFPKVGPGDNSIINPGLDDVPRRSVKQAETHVKHYLEGFDLSDTYPEDSWQRQMVSDCQSRLSIKAKKGSTILFYSQNPDGSPDSMSKHGGCPVMQGQKWAANLWIWNDIRAGYPHTKARRVSSESTQTDLGSVSSSSSYSGSVLPDGASVQLEVQLHESVLGQSGNYELYWNDVFWGVIEAQTSLRFNSFTQHIWNVKAKGSDKVVDSYTVNNYEQQVFTFVPPPKVAKATTRSQSAQTQTVGSGSASEVDLKSLDVDAVKTPEELRADAIAFATANRKKRAAAKAATKASNTNTGAQAAGGNSGSRNSDGAPATNGMRKTGGRSGTYYESKTIKGANGHAVGGHNRNPDGTVRDPTDPARFPRNRAVLPGSRVYTHAAKNQWDSAWGSSEL